MKTKLLITLFFTAIILKGQIAQKWLQLGTGLSKNSTFMPSMAFDRHGNLYLAYTDQSTPQNKATLKKFDGQNWSTVSNQFTPGQAQFVTLVLDTGDMPCVAFQEPYPVTKKITVMRYNGTSWDTIGGRGFALAHFNNPELSMRIDQNNNYWVAYREDATGKASIARNLFGLSWTTSNSMNVTQGDATKLCYDYVGSFLAFSNGAKGGKLSIITPTIGGSWVYVGDTTLSTGAVDYITIRRFANVGGFVSVITYKDLSDGKAYFIKAGVGASAPIPISNGVANYVNLPALSYDSYDGNIYCAYADGNQSGNATVKKVNVAAPSGTISVGKEGFTDTLGIFAAAYYSTMGIDNQDSLYLAVQSMNEYVVFKYRNVNTNPTGLIEHKQSEGILVFPNPAEDKIVLSTVISEPGVVRFYDMYGRLMHEQDRINGEQTVLDCSYLSPGTYFIEFSSKAGTKRKIFLKY